MSRSISTRIFSVYDVITEKFTSAFISLDRVDKAIINEMDFRDYDKRIEYYWEAFDTFHARASTLIGHLSIMIAVSTVALSAANPGIPKYLMMFEVISYIFLTLYTIRPLKSLILEADYKREEYIKDMHREITLKYAVTQVSLSLTIIVTILLLFFSLISFGVFS